MESSLSLQKMSQGGKKSLPTPFMGNEGRWYSLPAQLESINFMFISTYDVHLPSISYHFCSKSLNFYLDCSKAQLDLDDNVLDPMPSYLET